MKLGKIGLIIVSLSSVFFTTSCNRAKILTYDQAKAWVGKNCVEGKVTPISGYQFFDFSKTFGEKAREYVKDEVQTRYSVTLDENLIKKQPAGSEHLGPKTNLSVDSFEVFAKDRNAILNVLNNKLTITVKYDISTMAGLDGLAYRTYQFNKNGSLLLDEWSFYYMKSDYLGDRAAIIGKRQLAYNYK